MRKILTSLSLLVVLFFGVCTSYRKPNLQGGYQSEREGIGYASVMSLQQEESGFVEYIDGREVDRGTYEKTENNVYKIKSDKNHPLQKVDELAKDSVNIGVMLSEGKIIGGFSYYNADDNGGSEENHNEKS